MRTRLLLISSDSVLVETFDAEARGHPVELSILPSYEQAQQQLTNTNQVAPGSIFIDLQDGTVEPALRWAQGAFPDACVVLIPPSSRMGASAPPLTALDRDACGAGGDVILARSRERQDVRDVLRRAIHGSPHGSDAFGVRFDELIGRSVRFREALETAMKAAANAGAPVLIAGEKGTGKRLFARALHTETFRGDGYFWRVDCRAITSRGLEAILRGEPPVMGRSPGNAAYAEQDPDGESQQGTLFLEEISALDAARQAKVLGFLEESRRRARLNPNTAPEVARLIASTAKDLPGAVRAGQFDESLLARFSSYMISLPALRQRPSDILLLAERFLSRKGYLTGVPVPRFTREVQERLLAHAWSGNIRELFGVLEAALEAAQGTERVEPEHLPDWLLIPTQADTDVEPSAVVSQVPVGGVQIAIGPGGVHVELPDEGVPFEELERAILTAAMSKTNNNVVHAARLLRLGRGSLRYRLEKYGLVQPKRRRSGKRRPLTDADGGLDDLREAS